MAERIVSTMGRRMKGRMNALGYSQKELAARCKIKNPAFISDLLRGVKASVREPMLATLANALDVSPAWLEGATDDPTPRRHMRPKPPRLPEALRVPIDLNALSPAQQEQHRQWDAADEKSGQDQLAYERLLDQTEQSWRPPADDCTGGHVSPSLQLAPLYEPTLYVAPTAESGPRHTTKLPIFEGKVDKIAVRDGANARWWPRPASLTTPGAYGITVLGDELAPRIRAGETVLAAPRVIVRSGDDIVVIVDAPLPEANVVLAQFLGIDHKNLIVTLHGRHEGERKIKLVKVKAVHRIVAIWMPQPGWVRPTLV